MIKLEIIFCVLICSIFLNCNKSPTNNSIKYIEHNSTSSATSSCAYVLNTENNEIVKYICQQEGKLNGDLITYYPGGRIESLKTYHQDSLVGLAIDYYETGLIKRISSHLKGRTETEIKLFNSNGILQELSFEVDDSLYYARRFIDTVRPELYINLCKPILVLYKDTFSVFDSVQFHIRFPLPEKYNLAGLGFQLRYDRFPISVVQGKNPYATHSTPLDKEDIFIGITANQPSSDRFVYYVTDSSGAVISPTLFKDVYFIEKR